MVPFQFDSARLGRIRRFADWRSSCSWSGHDFLACLGLQQVVKLVDPDSAGTMNLCNADDKNPCTQWPREQVQLSAMMNVALLRARVLEQQQQQLDQCPGVALSHDI